MTDLHALITKMADELDQCHQLLMDDRRQRHPLADRARALLAEPRIISRDRDETGPYVVVAESAGSAKPALAEPDGCDFPVCIDDDSEEGTCSRWLAGSCEGPASAARAARRPQPTSLKELALARTDAILNDPNRALLIEVRETLELNRRALLAEPVAETPTDKELWELYQGPGTFSPVEYARAVLARWGRPTPQPVADGGEGK